MHKYPLRRLAAACLFIIGTLPVQAGTPSTSSGRISVAQVMAMLDESLSNTVAAQVLQAYLGGVGETAARSMSRRGAMHPMACPLPHSPAHTHTLSA